MKKMPGSPKTETPLTGTFSPVIKNTDGTVVLIKFLTLYGADMQRSFSEARGLVINDYQNVLEKQWVKALRNKYPLKITETVCNEMVN